MSKAVFIIDMPETCYYCKLCDDNCRCRAYGGLDEDKIVPSFDEKPDWCPLRHLPDKLPVHANPEYAVGWNACIDFITGGER